MKTVRYASLAVAAYVERFGGSGDLNPRVTPAWTDAARHGRTIEKKLCERAEESDRVSSSIKNASGTADSECSSMSRASSNVSGQGTQPWPKFKLPDMPLRRGNQTLTSAAQPPPQPASTSTVSPTRVSSDVAKFEKTLPEPELKSELKPDLDEEGLLLHADSSDTSGEYSEMLMPAVNVVYPS